VCCLQAYDSHCNLVLGEVEETIYTVDEEDEGGNGEVRTVKKQSEMLFVRGRSLLRDIGADCWWDRQADFRYRRLRCPHLTTAITTPISNWKLIKTARTENSWISILGEKKPGMEQIRPSISA